MQNIATIQDKKVIATVEGLQYKFDYDNSLHNQITTDIVVGDSEIEFNFKYIRSSGEEDLCIVRKTRKPFYNEDTPQLFDTDGITKMSYNDGMGSRSCHVGLLIYCKNKAYRFFGNSIPGIAVIENSSYTKSGKWSNTTFELALAAGWKAVKIQQGWDSGVYIDDVTSVKAMKSCLGLDSEVSNAVVAELVKIQFNKTHLRHLAYIEKMDALMDATEANGSDIVEFTFMEHRLNVRRGRTVLLLNDYPWDGQESDDVKIISSIHSSGQGGGCTTYKLVLSSDVTTEVVAERDPYGGDDDALEHRFYRNSEDEWVRIGGEILSEEEKEEQVMEDSPFAMLKDIIK